MLLVEPIHEARWSIPGGPVRPGETPRGACARELRDGLGLEVGVGRLLVVDWAPLVREERIRFVFDGGVLGESGADGMVQRKTGTGNAIQSHRIPDSVIRIMRHKGGLGAAGSHPAVFPVALVEAQRAKKAV